MSAESEINGRELPEIIKSFTLRRLLPSFPPGWFFAKSSGENFLASRIAIAKASPKINIAEELVVGAKFRGQASSEISKCKFKLEYFAKDDSSLPVMETIVFTFDLQVGKIWTISSVSPEN